jgi:geranylgeranyl pyrophosphate synthase
MHLEPRHEELRRKQPGFAAGPSGRALVAWIRVEHLPRIDVLIRDAVRHGCGAASPVLDLVTFQLDGGEPRLPAILPLLVAEALGGDPERVVPFAAACEVLRHATLVHDELRGGDRFRRGRSSAWGRFGVPRAIDLGEALLLVAVDLALRVPVPAAARLRASQRIVQTALALVHGRDCELVRRAGGPKQIPFREDYLALAAAGTGGLFSLSLAGAAELCGASPADVSALAAIAHDLGTLFQIQDDVLELHGDRGRDVHGSDLEDGKQSFLVVAARERLPAVQVQRLLALLDIPREARTLSEVEAVAALLDDAGALDAALSELARIRERALAAAPGGLEALVVSTMDAMLAPTDRFARVAV